MNSYAIRTLVIAGLATLALAACAPEEPSTAAPSDAADLAAAVEAAPAAFDGSHVDSASFAAAAETPGAVILDVRTPAEFASGHLPGAINIDVSAPGFADEIAELDAEGAYAVYCRSGNRSRAAIEQMTAAGLASTVGLEGGIGAWAGALTTD